MVWWCMAAPGDGEVESRTGFRFTPSAWNLAMTDNAPDMFAELPCHLCGYDLRAHPQDGRCPECGASVAESRRVAAIPRRPTWRDSDPRWRRSMLAGTWVLLLLPLMDLLRGLGWASRVPVPSIFDRFTVGTLDGALICFPGVYPPLVFCIGVVLLFSKERGRRQSKWDWTRRWGVLCSYVVLLLSAAQIFFIASLVLLGVAALFLSMPLKYQPQLTQLVVEVSSTYLRYGAQPENMAAIAQVAFSSITILLACVPLYDALRSSGRKWIAAILVAPLALFSLVHLGQAAHCLTVSGGALALDVYHYAVYFWPLPLVSYAIGSPALWGWNTPLRSVGLGMIVVEGVKWCTILAIAAWLSIAQLQAWRRRRKQR